MRILNLFLAPLISFSGAQTDDIDNLNDRDLENRFIKTMLDSTKPDELKQKKFCLLLHYKGTGRLVPISFDNFPPVCTIAWFIYGHKDECITIHYVTFYGAENFQHFNIENRKAPVNNFLRDTVRNKKIVDVKLVKKLKFPLPNCLKNDVLFDKMKNNIELGSPIADLHELNKFSFKSNKSQFTISDIATYRFTPQVKREILEPIFDAIKKNDKKPPIAN
jgi:hypothetical protein